jgi:hypothetical protein
VGNRWYNVVVDPVFDSKGELIGAVHVMYDMTDQETFRNEDVLTNLYNRYYFEAELSRMKPGQACGVIKCDIDGFKLLKHHERWDGAGYPLGLREKQIPVECRIMAVVDAGIIVKIPIRSSGGGHNITIGSVLNNCRKGLL